MPPAYDRPWAQEQVARIARAWESCRAMPLPPGPRYARRDQERREAIYDRAVLAVERETRKQSASTASRIAMQNRLIRVFGEFAATALDLPAAATDLITGDFIALGVDFSRQARRFDRSLPMNDIFQACRNAWTAGGLQSLLGERPEVTPSILGYSLLYPYSDNYMDSKKKTAGVKLRFSTRFRRRLCGETLAPEDALEAAVWASINLVETQYPRAGYPQVYETMLMIHEAQEQSVAQLARAGISSEGELLRISFAKGGSSVLVDACLASGRVSESEAELAFEWGTVLQLGDDLQDVHEDLRRGAQTLFTRAIQAGRPLDALATQLLNFSDRVAARMNGFPHGSATLKDLLRISWRSITLAAIAQATEFFSPAFLDEVEAGSPFRFRFLQSRNRRLARRNGVYAKLFNAILDEPGTLRSAGPHPAYIPSPIETNWRIWSSSAR